LAVGGPGTRLGVLEAAFWGLVGGAALLVGALVGLFVKTSQRTIGLIMPSAPACSSAPWRSS
jgi:hypothetical protein